MKIEQQLQPLLWLVVAICVLSSHSLFNGHVLVCRSFQVGDGAGVGLELGAGHGAVSTALLCCKSQLGAGYVLLGYSF